MSINPTKVRLSDSLLLSDFMGCDSVYRKGFANRITNEDDTKIAEGMALAEMLESIQEEKGPFSVSYGYISPMLSKKIVTYQDPNKPSYHRWDHGAAADCCFHDQCKDPPILLAHWIDDHIGYSRMITYSESEWICLGSRVSELRSGKYRKAFYENRYVGKRKPKYVQYPANAEKRKILKADITEVMEYGWNGQGWPSYHGGGRRQFHHERAGKYCMVSDFLYNPRKVDRGIPNTPYLNSKENRKRFLQSLAKCAEVYDQIVTILNSRVSIIGAFDSDSVENNWLDYFTMRLVPPVMVTPSDVADIVNEFHSDHISAISVNNTNNSVYIVGRSNDAGS